MQEKNADVNYTHVHKLTELLVTLLVRSLLAVLFNDFR